MHFGEDNSDSDEPSDQSDSDDSEGSGDNDPMWEFRESENCIPLATPPRQTAERESDYDMCGVKLLVEDPAHPLPRTVTSYLSPNTGKHFSIL